MNESVFSEIPTVIRRQSLGEAIRRLRSSMGVGIPRVFADELDDIESNYRLMADYMRRGYADPKREWLYEKLCQRLTRLAANLIMHQKTVALTAFRAAYSRSLRIALHPDDIRRRMEGHVSDTAMARLEGKSLDEKSWQEYIELLFEAILVSEQWEESFARFMADLLVSPTVDIVDAQVVVSATMLSCMSVFDHWKWQMMIQVYRQATDEQLRQRALVGWVLALPGDNEEKETVDELLGDERVTRELLELQQQVFYCLNAERDNDTIQKDIMPALLKNQHFTITRNGIEEKEEDPLEDILHPEAADQAMEEMEQSMRKMREMQQQGSDVFFGGFSQMKRFAFFHTLCNWFMPFHTEHPALDNVRRKFGEGSFLAALIETGNFCDSDKYSFALAMDSVIDQLPQSVREMLNRGEWDGNMEGGDDSAGIQLPAFNVQRIRRLYLQDLYRFFRLSGWRQDFRNPFDYTAPHFREFFFCNSLFVENEHMYRNAQELCRFLYKHKLYEEAYAIVNHYPPQDVEGLLLKGWVCLRQKNMEEARNSFLAAHELQPDNEKTWMGLARVSLLLNRYDEASAFYGRLQERYPDSKTYALNRCVAMIHGGHVGDALNETYRLDYLYTDDANIKRVLAWCLLASGRRDQAMRAYDWLMDNGPVSEDFQNRGYCFWLDGRVGQAIDMFRQSGLDPVRQFEEDKSLLLANGISEVDIRLMGDLMMTREETNDFNREP